MGRILFCFGFVGLDLTTASEHIVIDFQSWSLCLFCWVPVRIVRIIQFQAFPFHMAPCLSDSLTQQGSVCMVSSWSFFFINCFIHFISLAFPWNLGGSHYYFLILQIDSTSEFHCRFIGFRLNSLPLIFYVEFPFESGQKTLTSPSI